LSIELAPRKPDRRFLYREVANALRRRVTAGTYRPGSRIPTEEELVREFEVSGITVRRAIRDLTNEGLLLGRQGLGTFVTDQRRIVRTFGAELRASMADDMRRSGIDPGFQGRSLALVPCEEEIADRLGLRAGTRVYRLEKVLLADGAPVGLDVTFLPRKLGDLVRKDLATDFVLAVLRRHQVAMHHTDYEFQAGAAGEEVGRVLGLPVGFPLLVVRYTVVAPSGVAVLAGRTVGRADRFTYAFCGHPRVHAAPRARA
jgi:DNA-binding GntR family transcriptional regulator